MTPVWGCHEVEAFTAETCSQEPALRDLIASASLITVLSLRFPLIS